MAKSTKVDRSVLVSRGIIKATLESLKREAADVKRRASDLRKARYTVVQPVLTRLCMFLDGVPENDRYLGVSVHYGKVEITLALYNQDRLDSELVCELLTYANDICPNAKSRDYVGKDWGEREHQFSGDNLSIRIGVHVKSDSTCQRVLVGTKTVQQDEYRFVCPD